ncbi:MAG: hypothetical protein COU63_04695 [Candidatus Pacebacteria bacterium CG10_big_fil_rev_8_21_14_0_10_36_11]|nr:MAG: hypothetical protein AUK08_01920 [Candidatus Pacebacteria bacterium CG2_30_36_39]PIR64368.1 MAG: hypothetical protein COU63_04695 [Candidatus Pacebacteria bacterium CG10_big_fil_rev_8_21_14_0_10_36_11]
MGSQADGMARFAKITLSEEQRNLYKEKREPFTSFSDQQILAEVLRLTESTDLLTFLMAFKHMFLTELAAMGVFPSV